MTERITISIDKELLEELRHMAEGEGLSLSRFVSRSLEEFLIERKKKEAGMKLFQIKLSEDEAKIALEELSRMRRQEWRK